MAKSGWPESRDTPDMNVKSSELGKLGCFQYGSVCFRLAMHASFGGLKGKSGLSVRTSQKSRTSHKSRASSVVPEKVGQAE